MEKSRIIILVTIIFMVISSFICNNFVSNSYQVKFNCGKDCSSKIKYVKKGDRVKVIKSPKVKNKVFIEWQLNGGKYDFNSKVNKDIELKAKWLPEIYVNITIIDNLEDKNIKLLSGTSIKDYVKTPTRDGYKFLGWYINDKIYDLSKTVTSNIVLKAKWEKIENDEYKVGDKVLITGKYTTSAYSNIATNSVAIGWTREILAIYESTNYKYAIGDNRGITGYFNIDSFKRIN